MNFKTIGLSAIAAVAVTSIAVPSQAAILGESTLSLTGNAKLQTPDVAVGGTSELDFLGDFLTQEVISSTGSFGFGGSFGTVGPVAVKDLTLTKTAPDVWTLMGGPVNDFLLKAGSYSYNLTAFLLEKTVISGNEFYVANTTGSFLDLTDGRSIDAGGPFSSQGRGFVLNGSSLSGNVTAVPTPALLPGLLGFGVTLLRKRKNAEESVSV